jgi:protein kinase A
MAMKQMAAALLHHHSSSPSPPPSISVSPETIEHEKQFISHFSEQQHPLPPDEIAQDPRNKELGGSSKGLSVRDFELVRTLGTGAYCFRAIRRVKRCSD